MPTQKFKPGVSGNPKGRTAGKTPGAKLRKAIEGKADDILQAVINAAIDGDMQACKMLLDRITPSLKPQAMAISLPVKSTLAEQGSEIIKATMAGQIPPDIGGQLITALANQSKIVEIDDLTRRLEVLEAKNER
jgi:hypothetical protein